MTVTPEILWLAIAVLLILVVAFAIRLFQIVSRYRPIIDADAAVNERERECSTLELKAAKLAAGYERDTESLRKEYGEKKEIFDDLIAQTQLYSEELEAASFGLYQPKFDFDASDDFKGAIKECRAEQKEYISSDVAAYCGKNWSVDGSEAKGRAATKRFKKLLLRAFNGECDALIAKLKWDNASRMDERMEKAWTAISALGKAAHATELTGSYLELKKKELHLTHEYVLKRQEEREEQRLIKDQIREEERAQRELEKARREAETEEQRYLTALEKARVEAAAATGEKLSTLQEKLSDLEEKLQAAHDSKERAISRAQQTKSGHVYIISNVGSFGEGVFKVGMTRRLDPKDRVKELGDASVPFEFDVHAMAFSEDAPKLESVLHHSLKEHRVNKVNMRKEFFRIDATTLHEAAHEEIPELKFTKLAEARQYRETLAIEQANAGKAKNAPSATAFPEKI